MYENPKELRGTLIMVKRKPSIPDYFLTSERGGAFWG